MKHLIQFISNIFHPLLSMTWATVLLVIYTPLCLLPLSTKLFLIGEVVFYSLLLPCLIIVSMVKLGGIKNGVALRDRKDRIIPLGIQVVFYVIQAYALSQQGLPDWAMCFYNGAVILAALFFVVTIWWKMSGHAGANAALATSAVVLYFIFPYMIPLALPILSIIMVGAVSSIRVYLGRHTLEQVFVGAAAGSICMLISYFFI